MGSKLGAPTMADREHDQNSEQGRGVVRAEGWQKGMKEAQDPYFIKRRREQRQALSLALMP